MSTRVIYDTFDYILMTILVTFSPYLEEFFQSACLYFDIINQMDFILTFAMLIQTISDYSVDSSLEICSLMTTQVLISYGTAKSVTLRIS